MKQKKITQAELASRMMVSKSLIAHWCNGLRKPNYLQFIALGGVLQVSLDSFISDDAFKTNQVPYIGSSDQMVPTVLDPNNHPSVPIPIEVTSKNTYAIKADDDRMHPQINYGDIVYCELDTEIKNGDIVHYSLNKYPAIARYKINKEGTIVCFYPLDQEFEPAMATLKDISDLKMAKVIGVFSKLDN